LEQEVEVKWSDDEGDGEALIGSRPSPQMEGDIPEAICDGVADAVLTSLADFVPFCEPTQTPPVLAASMIRAMLLAGHTVEARRLFEVVFARSRKAQAMVVTNHIPLEFLSVVKKHRAASAVLRRLLAQYASMSREALIHLLGNVLLREFWQEKHCQDIVLSKVLVRDLVVHCRVQTRGISSTSDETEAIRLRRVGERLFNATFVTQGGFLLNSEAGNEAKGPWDTEDLDLPLLEHAPLTEDGLHLARRILLRVLVGRQRAGADFDMLEVANVWPLGRWAHCRDAELIGEAFQFLSCCWRMLRTSQASESENTEPSACERRFLAEEKLFAMFSELEFWRLPPAQLMTPWVPPQLLACHIASRCKLLDEQQRELFDENCANLQEINRLRHVVAQLTARLEGVDSRSVQSMQKQVEVADTLRSLR